jgi:hypothetical protein
MSYRGRVDRLERALGGPEERPICGPGDVHRCADPEAEHRTFTIRIDFPREDEGDGEDRGAGDSGERVHHASC